MALPADENQNAGGQRKNSGRDHRDSDVKESGDSNEDQINGQQEHSEVFGDDHASLLRQAGRVCTLKIFCFTTEDTRLRRGYGGAGGGRRYRVLIPFLLSAISVVVEAFVSNAWSGAWHKHRYNA
jgi:hypothetical protein